MAGWLVLTPFRGTEHVPNKYVLFCNGLQPLHGHPCLGTLAVGRVLGEEGRSDVRGMFHWQGRGCSRLSTGGWGEVV